MKNISIWEDTVIAGRSYPKLSGKHTTDVVVIGGGITGVTCAMLLSRAGKKVILVEARDLGKGTTGNSTGNLYSIVDEPLSTIRSKWNDKVMQAVVHSRRESLQFISETVQNLKIDCGYRHAPMTYYSLEGSAEHRRQMEKEMEACREAGLEATFHEGKGAIKDSKLTLTIPGQAQFQPLDYVRGVAETIAGQCEIYENSPVIDFDDEKGWVKTTGGEITAQHVIMATHIPKGTYALHSVLGPYREHAIAIPVNDAAVGPGIYWSVDQPKHSVRTHTHQGKNYLIVVGDKYKTGQGENTEEYVRGLREFAEKHFGAGDPSHVWAGQQYRPADGLPYIGKHGKHTYFITGFSTDGLIYGTLGARVIADMILDKTNPWEKTFDLKRFTPVKSFREFFKENLDNLMQYLKDMPWGADTDAVQEISRGEGKIVEAHGEKLAVYRDEQGRDHVCSAVCTHMKCVVNWNPAERTWDCPCHGSRFGTDGRVIEGPAVTGLPKKEL